MSQNNCVYNLSVFVSCQTTCCAPVLSCDASAYGLCFIVCIVRPNWVTQQIEDPNRSLTQRLDSPAISHTSTKNFMLHRSSRRITGIALPFVSNRAVSDKHASAQSCSHLFRRNSTSNRLSLSIGLSMILPLIKYFILATVL